MNRRGFFAAILAPLVVPWSLLDIYAGPVHHWPPDEFYAGMFLLRGKEVHRITGYVASTKVVTLQHRMNRHYTLQAEDIIICHGQTKQVG